MAKRKNNLVAENRRKKQRADQDAQLSNGLFASASGNSVSDVELSDEVLSEPEEWDEDEQEYELKPRKLANYNDIVEGLPIIGSDGKVQRRVRKQEVQKSDQEEEEEEVMVVVPEPVVEKEEDEFAFDLNDGLTQEQRIANLKEEIADLASKLIEDPEENFTALSRLRRMAESKNPNTSKLALLALVPVFKSICPSYRIRALTEVEKKEKVSREVSRLRNFEQSLVVNYKNYVELLAAKSRITTKSAKVTTYEIQAGRFATNAACELAVALRHFNYRAEVVQILCRRLSGKPTDSLDLKVYKKCISSLEALLLDDASAGDISFDVIRLLTKSIKARHYKIDESVVNILLSASIIEDYDPNGIADLASQKPKLKKKDRVHLSKKERKQRKENKKIEEEMRVAEQAVSEEERERFQAQILRLLLAIYLEILKNRPESLMASVLEGLAKYGHMANFDLLGDFLQVLREVSDEILSEEFFTSNELRQVLLCTVTSFALMSNHAQFKVSVDLSSFINALYKLLPYASIDPDLEFSHKTLRLTDPLSETLEKPSVNVSTKIEIILKSLENIFFKNRNGSKIRASAFTKRIYLMLLQTPEKSSMALLKFVENLMGRYTEICGLYSTEDRISNGVFHMDIDDPTRANPEAATLWETVLLENHYCPAVAKGAKMLFNKSKEADK